jgi:hypothetical protein
MTQNERMAQMFSAIDAEAQRYVLVVLRAEYERANRSRRPTLRLIQGGAQSTTAPDSTRTVVRIKNTGER